MRISGWRDKGSQITAWDGPFGLSYDPDLAPNPTIERAGYKGRAGGTTSTGLLSPLISNSVVNLYEAADFSDIVVYGLSSHLYTYISGLPPLIGKLMNFPNPRRPTFEALRKITISSRRPYSSYITLKGQWPKYNVRRFNAIPDLTNTRDTFAAKDGEVFVSSVFIPLVKKHGLEEKVGLSLLHHHINLKDGEKLAECRHRRGVPSNR
jgi:hypothetical protein